jgi:hypothetical protein
MNTKFFSKLVIFLAIMAAAATCLVAQDGMQTRSATSDDFVKQRPEKPKVRLNTSVPVRPRPKYVFVSANKNAVPWKHNKKAPAPKPANTPAIVTEIGVTLWKLRPPKANEEGVLLPVKINETTRANWLPERVGPNTIFSKGDKVRFAVESKSNGYLYVFDRETYSDGSVGEPQLIFPASLSQDNTVGPGMLADIPDQHEDLPYFSMSSKKTNYAGELLTVVISPRPWASIRLNGEGFMTNTEDLFALEFGSDVEIFSRTDAADRIYTKTESDAACGAKARQLERDTSTKTPCGTKSRQLTRDEAPPQSIYSVKNFTGQPAVAFVRLSVQP